MKTRKLTICLDVDDVLRDFSGKVKEVFLREHPQYVEKDIKPITSWDFEKFYPKINNLHRFVFEERAKEIYTTAPILNNALEEFKELKKWCNLNGHRLVVLSSQSRSALQLYTVKWLLDNGFDNDNVCIVRGDKTLINGDYLLDDGTHNLTAWTNAGKIAVCLDQDWNKNWTGKRVSSISQYMKLIIKKENGALL